MKIRHRYLWYLATASLAVTVLVAVVAVFVLRPAVRDQSVERLRAEATLVAQLVAEAGDDFSPQGFARRMGDALGVRVSLISADGTVLGDSSRVEKSLREMENHLSRPEVQEARRRGVGQNERISDTVHLAYFYVATLVDSPGPVRYARLALPTSMIRRSQRQFGWLVAGLALASTMLMAVMAYLGVRRISRPVEIMADAVERSGARDLRLSLPADGDEEIHRLGESLESMRRELLAKIVELGDERALLASVIEGTREGLLLVDSSRHVRLANRAVREIFELPVDPQQRPLTEAIRHPTVIRHIETALDKGVPTGELVVRMPGSDRAFQLQVTPVAATDRGEPREVLVLFFDVTRLERLEGVRREFVANVSHELRTPLTSIKAFVETLLDGGLSDAQNAERFLGIIAKHADRMGELIQDLTDLSLIETAAVKLDFREVDVAEVVRGVVEQLQPLAERRSVHLVVDVPGPVPLRADRRRLDQMLTNLVDNALKFTEADGEVRVRGSRGPQGVVISVEDEGIGIPAESQERIFNRFYQEDKGRSREVGGTGLGLAIVKHLMRLHSGRVRVESELGHGSVFRLEFPAETGAGSPEAA